MTAPTVPVIEQRGYQEILDEALARIPVHNPEWTNFNRSDPGVTIVELFAFLMEALAYRANQIPERNRRKFLSLLGMRVPPASAARGLVTFANERGALRTETLDAGVEVRAGDIPFRTQLGLDVLPVEGRAFVKQPLPDPPDELVEYYRQLYASHRGEQPHLKDVQLYTTTPLEAFGQAGTTLQSTADDSLWIALLLRQSDVPGADLRRAREQLAGRTVSLGIVPVLEDPRAHIGPGAQSAATEARLQYQLPQPPPEGLLPTDPARRLASYRTLDARAEANVLLEPGVVQVVLPDDPDALGLWDNLDPLEAGAGDFPPSLEDTKLEERLVTWLRVKAPSGAEAGVLWAGINAATVTQRAEVAGEVLPNGTGEPDQAFRLAHAPVVAGSVSLTLELPSRERETWREVDDLLAAPPEVPVRDPRRPPGTPAPAGGDPRVFAVEHLTGELRFGDGARGKRCPADAKPRVDYAYTVGAAANVAAGEIAVAPALPAGIRVANPVATWGGADAPTVAEMEKLIPQTLQSCDRLVTTADFRSIVHQTPNVEVGRVEVLPTYNPQDAPATPTPGAVTILVLPRSDALHPAAPEPDRLFLDAICRHLDPRRLVTTEVFLRGPDYVDVWISVGIDVEPGRSVATVRDAVAAALRRFLAPMDPEAPAWYEPEPATLARDLAAHRERGWPLAKPVHRLELAAVASRVPGVRLVRELLLAAGTGGASDEVPISGLQLPRVRAIAVGPDAADLDAVRGQSAPDAAPPGLVPVPVVPETC